MVRRWASKESRVLESGEASMSPLSPGSGCYVPREIAECPE